MNGFKIVTVQCIVANSDEPENARADLVTSAKELGLHVISSDCVNASDEQVQDAREQGFAE